MNSFAKRLLALASAAAIAMSAIPAVHAEDAEVNTEVLPAMARSAPFSVSLTREGLCHILMNNYKTLTGLTDEDLGEPEQMFLDTKDTDVLNAYALGLINAKGAGTFAPNDGITRQDFFTVCANLLRVMDYTYLNTISMDLTEYADGGELLAYAKQPAQVLLCIGALEADESGCLYPNQEITASEAVLMMDQVVSYYTEWSEDPVDPQRYLGEDVAEFALNYVGCRYVYGAKGPNKFDCSGFVYYVYKQFGYSLKPGARNQWKKLDERISKSDLLPGDLVFFSRGGRASRIFHVGIYIGDGKFVHAANSRKGVIVSSLSEPWYANRYHGAKRAIG